jgi:hypothetical protein
MDSLQQLLNTPIAKVLDDLIALREDRLSIENREHLLERTLELLVEQDPSAAAYLESPGNPFTPFGPLRMQIKRLLASYAFRDVAGWQPKAVLTALAEQGSRDLTIDNVRVTMRRMAQRGELLETDNLVFVLPTTLTHPVDQLEMPVAARPASASQEAEAAFLANGGSGPAPS